MDDQIKVGMLGFSRNKSIVSRLIRWLSRQQWSHVFVILEYDEAVKDHKIIEASSGGVRINSLKNYRKGYVVELCDMPDACLEEGLMAVKYKLGKKYGYFQLIGFIPVVLLRRVGIKMENPITKGVICSELAAQYLSAALDDPFWVNKADDLTPGDVYKTLHSTKGVRCVPLGS